MNVFGIADLLIIFIITPFLLTSIFRRQKIDILDYFLISITSFFFLTVPWIYIYLKIFKQLISIETISAAVVTLFVVLFFVKLVTRQKFSKIYLGSQEYFSLLVSSLIFLILHLLYYHFYNSIPEWDSYGNLITIEKVINSGHLIGYYRSFFVMSQAILSMTTSLSPYTIFTTAMIAVQICLPIIVIRLLDHKHIDSKILRLLLPLAAITIPALSLEYDFFRPQTMFLLAMPIYIYFCLLWMLDKNPFSLFLLIIISLFGPEYHEFFFFLTLHLLWIAIYHIFSNYRNNRTSGNLLMGILLLLLFISLFTNLYQLSPTLKAGIATFSNQLYKLKNAQNWNLWFLGNYNTDGLQYMMGWPGITGALKYYGYYLGPFCTLVVILLFWPAKKTKYSLNIAMLMVPFLSISLFFSELLPRLSIYLLPERFWLIAQIALVFVSIGLITPNSLKHKIFIFGLILAILVSISGTTYIAYNKKSLALNDEKNAALWLKKNTDPGSVIFTQANNVPLISYFAGRKGVFLNDGQLTNPIGKIIFDYYEQRQDSLSKLSERKNEILKQLRSGGLSAADIATLADRYKFLTIQEDNLKSYTYPNPYSTKSTYYFFYSTLKKNNLYNQRQWWSDGVLLNLDPDNLSKSHPLIYNRDGVYIWILN